MRVCHHKGEVLFEYELPLNTKIEKITEKLIALNYQQMENEYIGFYFGNEDSETATSQCSMFSSMLIEIA